MKWVMILRCIELNVEHMMIRYTPTAKWNKTQAKTETKIQAEEAGDNMRRSQKQKQKEQLKQKRKKLAVVGT
jgi:hypothetical protein